MGDVNVTPSHDEFKKRLQQYDLKREDLSQWDRCGLKNLKFTNDSVEPKTTTQRSNGEHELHMKRSSASFEPNAFQKAIMAMDYESFINDTNVKELVRKSFEIEMKPLTEETMNAALKQLEVDRYHFSRYHKGLLHHLKMLRCECQQNKKFADKSTQTDPISHQDADVQCHSVKCVPNESDNPGHNDNSHQSKLNLLSVHEVTESEIIHIAPLSDTEGKKTSTNRDMLR